MKNRLWQLLAPAFVIALALGASHVASADVDWSQWWPDADTIAISATTTDSAGATCTVTGTRGPIVGGTFDFTATVDTSLSTLAQVRVLVGTDSNHDGLIQASEWSLVTSAAAAPGPLGHMVATTPSVTLSATADAYRIEHVWTGWGTSNDTVFVPGVSP